MTQYKGTINVIFTARKDIQHYDLLTSDNVLLHQLDLLTTRNVLINILLNGETSCIKWNESWLRNNTHVKNLTAYQKIGKVSIFRNEGNVLPHGAALNYLHKRVGTRYYINIDEDDEFDQTFIQNPESLFEGLPEGKLITYKFRWVGTDFQTVRPKKDDYGRFDLGSINGFSGWNFIFDKITLDKYNLLRPEINYMNDCPYYLQLWLAYNGLVTLKDRIVIVYRSDHSLMSKQDSNPDLRTTMNYLLEGRDFSLDNIIK